MTSTDKTFYMTAFFEEFEEKINRLKILNDADFEDEAKTLCLVYIDRLASGKYFDGQDGNSKKNFCRALRELSSDQFFSAIHPNKLLETVQNSRFKAKFTQPVKLFIQNHVGCFLIVDEIRQEFQKYSLSQEETDSFFNELWRASVAAICYERVRNSAIHDPAGSNMNLSFSETSFEGKQETSVTFERLYGALRSVFTAVKEDSIVTEEWFGNSLFP
jgi:hypothetical protein